MSTVRKKTVSAWSKILSWNYKIFETILIPVKFTYRKMEVYFLKNDFMGFKRALERAHTFWSARITLLWSTYDIEK